jgi:ABC-2 type transport system permease protein
MTTAYRMLVRGLVTRGRLLALGLLGLAGAVVALSVGLSHPLDPLRAGTDFVNAFGLSVYAPVTSLVFASAALGDLVEDQSLVHLWLRPIARWRIALAAYAAAFSVAVPFVLVTLLLSAACIGGGGNLLVGTVESSLVAVVAYTGIFVFVGLRTRRALVWGLAYILLWEGFVAVAGRNATRLAVRAYTRTLLADATGRSLRLATISIGAAVIVPVAVAMVAFALTTWRLKRMEVA